MREGKPMKLTSWFVDRPCTVMLTAIGMLVLIAVISYLLGFFKMTEQHRREYLIWDDEKTYLYDMREAAIDKILVSKGEFEQPVRFQEAKRWDSIILYKGPTEKENLLKKDYLVKMK